MIFGIGNSGKLSPFGIHNQAGGQSPPLPPVADEATDVTGDSFSANWAASVGATGYYLDVSTSAVFASFVPGFENLDVGNVTDEAVTGLTIRTDYYYRVRAYNTGGTSADSNVIETGTYTPETFAYVARQSTPPPHKYKVGWDKYIIALKTPSGTPSYTLNLATIADTAYWLAGQDSENSLLDLIRNETAVRAGGMIGADWTEGLGYKGNGIQSTGKKIRLSYNPSTDASAVTSLDFMALIFITVPETSTHYGGIGGDDIVSRFAIEPGNPALDTTLYGFINSASGTSEANALNGLTSFVTGVGRAGDVNNGLLILNGTAYTKAKADLGFTNDDIAFFQGYTTERTDATIAGGIVIKRSAITPAQLTAAVEQYYLDIA